MQCYSLFWVAIYMTIRRVLLVADVFPESSCGDAEHALSQHALALNSAGIPFSILSKQPEPGASLKVTVMGGVDEYRLPYDGDRGWRGLAQLYFGARKWWKQYGEGFSVVVAEQSSLMWMIVNAGCRLPYLQFCYNFAYEDYVIQHGCDWHWYHTLSVAVIRRLEARIYRRATRLFVLSDFFNRRLSDKFNIEDGVDVVQGGASPIDVDLFSARDSLRMEQGLTGPVAVSVCNLDSKTGIDLLVQTAVICRYSQPDLRWVVMGTGPLLEPLQHLANELGVADRIEFTGLISDEDMKMRLVSADLFILPLRAMESYGLATLDANSCGLPVVATPVGGNVEMIRSLPFPNRVTMDFTPESLAHSVSEMIEDLGGQDIEVMRQSLRSAALQYDWTKHNTCFLQSVREIGE